jgi:hypothetical protein
LDFILGDNATHLKTEKHQHGEEQVRVEKYILVGDLGGFDFFFLKGNFKASIFSSVDNVLHVG